MSEEFTSATKPSGSVLDRTGHKAVWNLTRWNIKFAPLLIEQLGHRDEMHIVVGGIKHWLWRAVDEQGTVLDILLQEHRAAEAAKALFTCLLGK